MNTSDPVRPYDPDKVSLRTKIERHLRRRGWKQQKGDWTHPVSGESHTLTAAVRLQLQKEGLQ